jgi:hypothetical protein
MGMWDILFENAPKTLKSNMSQDFMRRALHRPFARVSSLVYAVRFGMGGREGAVRSTRGMEEAAT